MVKNQFMAMAEDVHVDLVGEDQCLLSFEHEKVLMSYDAAYDLALRLAQWIQKVGEGAPSDLMLN